MHYTGRRRRRRRRQQMSILVALATYLAGVTANCAHGTSVFPRLPNVTVSSFGYDALVGPLNWFGLNQTANVACEHGTQQSPIVINSTIAVVPGSLLPWTVQDYPDGAEFENLGTNVEVLVNGTLVDPAAGVLYNLAQFHFHTPGEHRLDDEFFPMEMHWVFESAGTIAPCALPHRLTSQAAALLNVNVNADAKADSNGQDNADASGAAAKQFAVIAFLVELCADPGCTDPVLDAVFSAVDEIAAPGEAVMTGPLAFEELIAKFSGSGVFSYSGSLTTPPCTESVNWFISTELLFIDVPTWLAVKKVIKFNARYTQDMLGSVNLLQNVVDELCGG